MAEQLLLVKTYDFESDQGTVDLFNRAVHGFEPAYGGWTPETRLNKRSGNVEEAITLRVQGTSTDDIATKLQRLAEKSEEVDRYFLNGARDYAVWFRVQQYGESKARQSLVYELRHEPASSVYDVSLRSAYHWNKYTLGMSRAPWWEGTACGTITGATVNTCGGTLLYSGTVNGDLDGRWAQVKLTNMGTVHAIFPSGRAWLGYKSSRYGSAGSFVPFWSFAGTIAYPDNRITGYNVGTADSTAKGGTSIYYAGGTTVPGPLLMQGVTLSSVTASPSYYQGSYRVLVRARMEGTAQYLMQLQAGWRWDYYMTGVGDPGYQVFPNAVKFPRVSIEYSTSDSTSRNYFTNNWHFYDVGEVNIPPFTHMRSQATLADFALLLYAEWISGTGDLWMDGFVLIPLDGFMQAEYTQNTDLLFGTALYAVQSPDGILQAATLGSVDTGYGTVATWMGANVPIFRGGMTPGTAGMFVLAADSYLKSMTTTNLALEIKYFERWQSMRGNE